jgi:hypothetical protein
VLSFLRNRVMPNVARPANAARRRTFATLLPAPVVGNPGTTITPPVFPPVFPPVLLPTGVATNVPLQGAAVIVLYPSTDVQPARNDIAVGPPLHGVPVVMLYPRAVVQPANGPTVAVVVPLQGVPVVTLNPSAEEQPDGNVAVCALAVSVVPMNATPRTKPNIRTKPKSFFVINLCYINNLLKLINI